MLQFIKNNWEYITIRSASQYKKLSQC